MKWQWSDGSPWTFQNWALGEPNDSGEDEDHVVVWATGRWNDAMENKTFPFICQHETKGNQSARLQGGPPWPFQNKLKDKTETKE